MSFRPRLVLLWDDTVVYGLIVNDSWRFAGGITSGIKGVTQPCLTN